MDDGNVWFGDDGGDMEEKDNAILSVMERSRRCRLNTKVPRDFSMGTEL